MTRATSADQSLVRVRGLGRDYAGVTALEELDLDLAEGKALALVGHNGSGKTTALSMIAGRLEPSRGTVEIAGVDTHRRGGSSTLRSLVSFVPDAPALYNDLTVIDHLELVGMAHGVDDYETRAKGLLERFGLGERRHLLPRELSRGLRQKAQLACAMLRPFAVLVLDEPVAGLDPPSRQSLHTLLCEAKDEGAVVLFSTHLLEFAQGLVDRVVVLRNGGVVTEGTYEQVVKGDAAGELGLG